MAHKHCMLDNKGYTQTQTYTEYVILTALPRQNSVCKSASVLYSYWRCLYCHICIALKVANQRTMRGAPVVVSVPQFKNLWSKLLVYLSLRRASPSPQVVKFTPRTGVCITPCQVRSFEWNDASWRLIRWTRCVVTNTSNVSNQYSAVCSVDIPLCFLSVIQ
jgi:hypothetical protein